MCGSRLHSNPRGRVSRSHSELAAGLSWRSSPKVPFQGLASPLWLQATAPAAALQPLVSGSSRLSTPARGWSQPTAADSRYLARRRFLVRLHVLPSAQRPPAGPLCRAASGRHCSKTRSVRASPSTIFLHHRQLSTLLLVDRSAALHSFGLRRAVRLSSSVCARVLFACPLLNLAYRTDSFAPCLLCLALPCFASFCSALLCCALVFA